MRDFNGCSNSAIPVDAIYKEVVIVGNGPSGMSLSYLLSGHWPYYTGAAHPDDMLTARLRSSPSRSLIHQDLQFLSQGLEGRSGNPVSVLMDCLSHPGADSGMECPPLLQWRSHTNHAIDHIVLGKGPPGGAWQAMDGNVLTISLSSWLELPGLEWRRWEGRAGSPPSTARRVPVSSVAAYYRDYIRLMRLSKYFRNGVVVTSVTPLPSCGQSGELEGQGCHCRARWLVEGYDSDTNSTFSYVCRSVVLATGSTDRPNLLGVEGELAQSDWVFHDLAAFEAALANLAKDNPAAKDGVRQVDPVCVVGAGLSAADAVLAAKFHSVPVIHVYRQSRLAPERTLPENMYPEYHKVHQMMTSRGAGYPDYHALQGHKTVSISPADHKVTSESPSGIQLVHQVSLLAVLIGSRPDLSLLPQHYHHGQTLAVDPSSPVNCRKNPFSVNPFTHSVGAASPGFYSLGPLTGDNFVRYLLGGAVAVASDLYRHHKEALDSPT